MHWEKSDYTSTVTLYWDIPASARYSYYRLHYYAANRHTSLGTVSDFDAVTRTFYVSYKYLR